MQESPYIQHGGAFSGEKVHHFPPLLSGAMTQGRLGTSPICDPQDILLGHSRCPRTWAGNPISLNFWFKGTLLKSATNLYAARLEFQILGLITTLLSPHHFHFQFNKFNDLFNKHSLSKTSPDPSLGAGEIETFAIILGGPPPLYKEEKPKKKQTLAMWGHYGHKTHAPEDERLQRKRATDTHVCERLSWPAAKLATNSPPPIRGRSLSLSLNRLVMLGQ